MLRGTLNKKIVLLDAGQGTNIIATILNLCNNNMNYI